jgi:integrase
MQIRWTYTGLVFTTDLDGPVDPRNLLRAVELTAANAGIENVGAHPAAQCRGGLTKAGVHIKAVADPVGHTSIASTGDSYGHTSDATARAVDRPTSTLDTSRESSHNPEKSEGCLEFSPRKPAF